MFDNLRGFFRGLATGDKHAVQGGGSHMRPAPDLPPQSHHLTLELQGTDIEELPEGLSVQFGLNLRGCHRLRQLPDGLRAGTLDVSDCPLLECLPEGLDCSFVNISDCSGMDRWPEHATISVGRLRARNCLGLPGLPSWLGPLSQLDLVGCAQIHTLPENLVVTSWIDVAGTGIQELPPSLSDVGLRWRGVTVDHRIAFHPESITAEEVLRETNAELRRVKMERMGFARFVAEADPVVLDTDTDPGGERKLFRVELPGDEPLVCVMVNCPSTARQYLLRVPPDMKTCRQAVAWTAGFDDPKDYAPRVET